MMSKALPEITPREANIRHAAHLYDCFYSERVAELCIAKGISLEEMELGWQRYEQAQRERMLDARVYGSPEYGSRER